MTPVTIQRESRSLRKEQRLCEWEEWSIKFGSSSQHSYGLRFVFLPILAPQPSIYIGPIRYVQRRRWHPTPVLLPGKSHGRRSLVGCSPWGHTFTFQFHALEKEMATHSSVLAWRIPGTGDLVGCHLWGCTESDMTEAT